LSSTSVDRHGGGLGLAAGHDEPGRAGGDERADGLDDGADRLPVVGRPLVPHERPRPVGRGAVGGPRLSGEPRCPVGVGQRGRRARSEQGAEVRRERLAVAAEPVVARPAGEVV
jgi:hypothetical protein